MLYNVIIIKERAVARYSNTDSKNLALGANFLQAVFLSGFWSGTPKLDGRGREVLKPLGNPLSEQKKKGEPDGGGRRGTELTNQ